MTSPPQETAPDEAATGLPLLRTWPAVYLFVLAVFVLWVALMATFSRMFA
jgi:hypothetical protein